MRFPRAGSRYAMVGLLGIGLAGSVGVPQKSGPPPSTLPDASQSAQDPFGQQGDPNSKINMPPFGSQDGKQAKLRDEERQKHLIADTDKLLALATQLHDDVARTDRHILSIDVVKRADEIEKLAHSVKEREKG